MDTETTITLYADELPLFAHKRLDNGEYVEVEAAFHQGTYTVRRCYMGMIQWQKAQLVAAEVVSECEEWGLDNWTPTLYGE